MEIKELINIALMAKNPLVLMLDGIKDPRNFGAILRTAEAANVSGVIIPKKRSVQLNDTVYKTSTGASDLMSVVTVSNLNQTALMLKEKGFWLVGLEASGKDMYYELDFAMPTVLVIGSEGEGISHLLKKNCDFMAKIPMLGKITSLNASVATGIVIYEILRQKLIKQ